MKTIVHLLLLFLAMTCASFGAQPALLLPSDFAGWHKQVSHVSRDPAQADPAFAPLLKEYGFTDFEGATYAQNGRTMMLKAARFADASGAYGAFTFYKEPQMLNEQIGDQGSSSNTRVLFYRGNILVDTRLDHVTAMSAAELRELASDLPLPTGSAANLPSLPTYLPRQAYVKNSARYVMGPIGLNDISAPVLANLVGFNDGAEVALAHYSTGEGEATLMIISYPTPQIAAAKLRTIESSYRLPDGSPASGAAALQTKRSGPLVAIVSGQISTSEAKSLLASVNYDADVTWNQNTFLGNRDNIGNLLVGIIILIAILMGFALVLGILFGGFRIVMKRMFPDRVFDRSKDVEIISLKLGENR